MSETEQLTKEGHVSMTWEDPECDPVAAIRQLQAEVEWLVQQLFELKVKVN